MLDEIDKVGADWRGDPSSALLEVLDPAQNHSFVDNYLGVGFDLSQVLFLTTANTLDTIPAPLRDRMEVLTLSGYTDAEKVQIARAYLVPKQIAAHGLRPEELTIEDSALRAVIRGYTREAGVRNLDREVASLCRKVAREIAEGRTEPKVVTGRRTWSGTSGGSGSSTRWPSGRSARASQRAWPGRHRAATCCSWKRPACRVGTSS